MKKQFQSKSVPQGTRTIWRYLSAFILFFALSIGNVWAATENNPTSDVSSDAEVSGISYSLPSTLVAGQANQSTGMDRKGVKTRTNKTIDTKSNVIKFAVKSGYKITAIELKGTANSSTAVTIGSYSVDAGASVTKSVEFPTSSGTAVTYSISGFEATSAIYFYVTGGAGQQLRLQYTITYEEISSGPENPTITFTDGAYTIGGSALDLSTLFSSNSAGAVTYTVKTDGGTSATIDGTNFTATAEGTCVVTASQAEEIGKYNAGTADANIVVSAPAPAACPEGLTISGTKDYTAGQTISLEAALEAGNGEITYNWYKGDDLATAKAAGSIGTSASFSKASCATSDAGNYWCVASKDDCSDAESAAYAVTVAAAIDPWIIKVALSGTSGAAQTMSGTIGGTAAVNGLGSSSPYKLSNDGTSFVALTLATGNFYPGDSVVLDISKTAQIFYGVPSTSQTVDAITPKLLGTTSGSGSRYFILPNTLPANTNTIFVGRTSSTYNGTLTYMAVYRTPICPSGLTISGEKDYVPGDKIELTASLAKGNGEISYQWYKGSVAAGNEIEGATSAKLEIADCVAGDAGDYYCIASKEDCSDAVNAAAYTITVNDFVAVTGITISPASPTVAAKSKITLTAEVAPVEATNKVVEWSVKSGSEAYASVNATTGEVTGKAEGNAVIVATATDGSGVYAEKTVVVTPFVCPTSGTIYSFVSDGTKAPGSNTYCPASGVQGVVDIATYATVSGGLAQGVHTTTSNNPIQIQTSTSAVKLSHADGYFRALLECPLQEGDTIKFEKTNKVKMAFDSLRTKVVEIASGTGANKDYYIVPATYAGEDTIMVYYGGSSVNLTALRVIRPAKYAVTFNMHGHGDAVDPQTILKGGKVTEPATTDITGWDFGGWYKTYVAEPESYSGAWDFENDIVSAATELHAKWTEHVKSSDATLSSLTVNGEAITLEDGVFGYAFELPMGTTALPTIVAVPNDSHSKGVSVVQTNINTATITVTAEDDSFKDYTISFTVATSKDIEMVWSTSYQRCDETTPTATAKIAAMSQYLSASYTGSAAEGGSLNTGKTTGSKIIITAKPGYAFKAMGFYGKIEDVTCNFYNDGVVETIGTSNTDACYADVFSNDEVHEFIIELTGTNGVYIRNMQLTIIEACTPITLAWDEEPVEFEVGKAGYAIAATANNGGTVSYSSESAAVVDVVAATGALTISGLGSATLKAATAEGDGTTYCENGGENIEISKAVNTYYLVKFDAQNGDAADEVKYYDGDAAIALPADPTFAGYDFQGWFDAETGGNQYTAAITPTASTTVYAQWVAQCAGATITTQPTGASYLTGRTATALVCVATAGNGGELTYEWFTCDDEYKANPVAATATPSTAVAGTFYYFCKVTEAGCGVEAFSDVVTITVADKTPICLIATTITGATAHGDVTGLYGEDKGGSADVNVTGSSYKMDKGKYIGVTLPEGYTFQEGDKVVLNVMTVNNATGFTLFDGKDGEKNLIIDTRDGVLVPAGANTVVLPAYAGSQSVYVLREDNNTTGDLNSAIDAIAVYRTCAPILNKVTVNGVEGKPNALNQVVFEVAASTSQSQLEAIAFDWVSNDDAWTAAHAPVAANAWEFGVANAVTFTDKDGDQSVYTITVNKAVPSSDATLSALSYGTPATAIALADGVYTYDVELPYGTSDVPALAATKNHVGATIVSISDAAAFVDRKATSTVTVKAEDDATTQVYTVNFTVDRYETTVLWDGSMMDELSDITALSIETADISVDSKNASFEGKNYTKALSFGGNTKNTRYFGIVVPEGKVAKVSIVYRSRGTSARSIIIGTAIASAIDESAIVYATKENDTELLYKLTADIFAAGTIYINTTNGFQVFEINVQLADGYGRSAMLGAGVYGTVCVPNNVAVEDIQGVTVYELMGREPQYGKLAFDEIVSGELEAGAPYVFQAHGNHMALLYGEISVDAPVDKGNGMYGTFVDQTLTELNDIYYFAQKALWSCVDLTSLSLPANRAYVKLSEIDYLTDPTPAPGRRRVTMAVNGKNAPTGIDAINASEKPMKIMIDGQIYILRGEKVFDATGRLVK